MVYPTQSIEMECVIGDVNADGVINLQDLILNGRRFHGNTEDDDPEVIETKPWAIAAPE